MKKSSLFICEDDLTFLNALKVFVRLQDSLELAGVASDGFDALNQLSANPPDICLVDLAMPGMDGVELINQMNQKQLKTKIIVLSQNADETWLGKLIANEVDAFILKSDGRDQLMNAIEAVRTGDKYFSPSVGVLFYQILSRPSVIPNDLSSNIHLTTREKEVALLTSKGMSIKEIAREFNCTENTVKTHKKSLMKKIQARNSAEVTSWTIRHGVREMSTEEVS